MCRWDNLVSGLLLYLERDAEVWVLSVMSFVGHEYGLEKRCFDEACEGEEEEDEASRA